MFTPPRSSGGCGQRRFDGGVPAGARAICFVRFSPSRRGFMPKISGVCVGESLVGDGNEVAHVDLLLGPRGSAVETAFCNALTNNKDGFTTLLAVIAPNLLCKPPTILYNKVTIKDAR